MSKQDLLDCICTEAIESSYKRHVYTKIGNLRQRITLLGYSRRQAGQLIHALLKAGNDADKLARLVVDFTSKTGRCNEEHAEAIARMWQAHREGGAP